MGIAFWNLFTAGNTNMTNIWLFGIGIAVYYLFFNVGHFMLAEKYSKIAKKVPAMLNGKPEEVETTCNKVNYWLLFLNNVISALAYGYSLIPYYRDKYVLFKEPKLGFVIYRIVATFWVRICSIISGYILVVSVLRVKNFFKERNAEDFINTPMLLRHGIAFGLYLLGTILSGVSLVFVNLNPDSVSAYNIFSFFYIVDFLMEFISQILLCQIFWAWGTDDKPKGQDNDDPAEIETTDFDENDFDAKIWNTMVRKRLENFEKDRVYEEESNVTGSTNIATDF
jgi:hypothetical protein